MRIGSFTVRSRQGRLTNSIGIVELDPGAWHFSLGLTPGAARRTADSWLNANSELALAVNTGLFSSEGRPLGLVRVDGVRRYQLLGWLDAVVVIEDGGLRLTDVAGAAELAPGASAFQTLPWLVRDGRVVFGSGAGRRLSSTHRDRRLALCFTAEGKVLLVLSSFELFGASAGMIPIGLTLPEQAALVAGLGCRDAAALDGGISAQVAARVGERLVRMSGWRRVPLMLLARRR
jgi:exopolysaccharide biosynthesis protein